MRARSQWPALRIINDEAINLNDVKSRVGDGTVAAANQ